MELNKFHFTSGIFKNHLGLDLYIDKIISILIMKKFKFINSIIALVIIVLNVAHIEFPFKRLLLYIVLIYIIFIDLLLPLFNKIRNNK